MAAKLEAGTPLALAIQAAAQSRIVKNGWASEENDETLAEYVTMMLVNGKPKEEFAPELGNDLLNTSPEDPEVIAFAGWLFDELARLRAMQNGAAVVQSATAEGVVPAQQMQDGEQDAAMIDEVSEDSVNPMVPSGPKAMRNGAARAPNPSNMRDRRMLGQLNKQLDRSQDVPEALRRIKGAASRVDSHAHGAGLPPKGPKAQARQQNLANGVQRMANARPTAAQMNGMGMSGRSGVLPPGPQPMGMANPTMPSNPQEQERFMAMMTQSMAMAMMQVQQNGGQMPPQGFMNPAFQQNTQPPSRSLFDRVNQRQKRLLRNRPPLQSQSQGRDADMQDAPMSTEETNPVNADGSKKAPFDTLCRFNNRCTNADCPFAHQSPAAPPGTPVDLSDTCSFGIACENRKCTGKHPCPGPRKQQQQQQQQISATDCRFYPHCTNPRCPFRHPDMPACRNGADCNVVDCKFSHSQIVCRYNPCLNPKCQYKHADGQKRGQFEDKVWKSPGTNAEGFDREAAMVKDAEHKSERFAGLKEGEGLEEELILPGSGTAKVEEEVKTEAQKGQTQESSSQEKWGETQITV